MSDQSVSPPDLDPRSAVVLEQARRDVRERRVTAAVDSAARQRPWAWVSAGLVVSLVMLLVVWPAGTLVDRLRWLMHGVCDQVNNIPAWQGGLPLDARCTGIYAASLATLLYLVALRRLHATMLPSRPLVILLISAVAIMAFDGLNSALHQSGYNLYPPHHALRLATGVGAGLAFAVLGLPLLNGGLRAAPRPRAAVITSWTELALLTGLVAVIGVLAWQGLPWFFYPLVLLSLTGMIGGLWIINLAAVLLLNGLYRRVMLLAQFARPAALSIMLTAGELIVLAWLRTALEQ